LARDLLNSSQHQQGDQLTMQEQKKAHVPPGPSPSRAKPQGDSGPVSEPFFDSGLREEKPPRSGEEHGGAADAGHERWAKPGIHDGPPPELSKPTGGAEGSPSEGPKSSPTDDDGDG
jgi:hypothetical protein